MSPHTFPIENPPFPPYFSSMEEIEVKILEIDPIVMQKVFLEIGAEKEFDQIFEATFYDLPDHSIKGKGELLRLRIEGEQSVLTYKQPLPSDGAKVMKETETGVEDGDAMKSILAILGYQAIKHTLKRRIQYRWQDCHIVIDDYQAELAAIPPFIEIEAPTRKRLTECLQALDIDPPRALPWNTYDLAKHYGLA